MEALQIPRRPCAPARIRAAVLGDTACPVNARHLPDCLWILSALVGLVVPDVPTSRKGNTICLQYPSAGRCPSQSTKNNVLPCLRWLRMEPLKRGTRAGFTSPSRDHGAHGTGLRPRILSLVSLPRAMPRKGDQQMESGFRLQPNSATMPTGWGAYRRRNSIRVWISPLLTTVMI